MVQRLLDFAIGVYTEPAATGTVGAFGGIASGKISRPRNTTPRRLTVNFEPNMDLARPSEVMLIFTATGTVNEAGQTVANLTGLGAPTVRVPAIKPYSQPALNTKDLGSLDIDFSSLTLTAGQTYDVAVIGNYPA